MNENSSSFTALSESGDDSVDGVLGVVEGRDVAGAPRELRADTGEVAVFDVVLGGEVGNFLLGGLENIHSGHEGDHLHHGELLEVSDVAEGLELLQVTGVVDEVEHEIILHGNVEGLHFLGGVAALADSAVNSVLGQEELLISGLDLVDDTGGVGGLLVGFPVDLGNSLLVGGSVEVIEDRLQLTLGLTTVVGSGGGSETLQPVVGQFVGCNRTRD